MTGTLASFSTRCFGTGDPLMEQYHDEEWGRPVRDDVGLFERIALEVFQSGLSWSIVLRKREAFRRAFLAWNVRAIAGFQAADIERLLKDPEIIRNRRKIESTITNARALVALWQVEESLSDIVWSHTPRSPVPGRPLKWSDAPTETPESQALARSLKSKGFVFIGPVTMYALMQACGLVDPHLAACPVVIP